MKFLLDRARQEGVSNSRVATVVVILAFAILAAVFGATSPKQAATKSNSKAPAVSAAPACTASTIFSASFTQGQDASTEVQQQWRDFIQSLTPSGYDTVTISGTNDPTGRTLTDATIVPQIAAAMQNGTGGSWPAGGFTWNVGINCVHVGAVELNANAAGDATTCACQNPGYIVRPNISPGNPNWGGVNSATCGGPSQTMTVTFSGPGPATPPCATPPSGMVSWWPAEGDANDIQDGNDGTFNGTPAYGSGRVGQAFSFNGDPANYVSVPSNTNLDLTQFTVDAWVYPTTSSGIRHVVDKEPPSSNSSNYYLALEDSNTVEFGFMPGQYQYVDSTVAIPVNTWTHLTGTYDGTTVRLYINGVLNVSTAADPSFLIPPTGQPLAIGIRNSAFTNAFVGLIDEVEIFNRALTGAEVLSIYNAQCTGKCRSCASAPGSMVSWWKAEGNTTDSQDSNDGTFNGTPGYGAGEVG